MARTCRTRISDTGDPLLDYMIEEGLSLDRETYLMLDRGDPDAKLSWEEEANLPERFQDWEASHEEKDEED